LNDSRLTRVVSEILGQSQIYIRGPSSFWAPPSGNIFVLKASTLPYLIVNGSTELLLTDPDPTDPTGSVQQCKAV